MTVRFYGFMVYFSTNFYIPGHDSGWSNIHHKFNDTIDAPGHLADASVLDSQEQTTSCSAVSTPDNTPLSPTPESSEQDIYHVSDGLVSLSPLTVDKFTFGRPGVPISPPQDLSASDLSRGVDPGLVWFPFRSQCDWEVARWAKMRGPSSTAVTELLAIPGVRTFRFFCFSVAKLYLEVVKKLDLSYRTADELNNIIDRELHGRPPFQCKDLMIGNEQLQLYYRNALLCIRALYGDPAFAHNLAFAPEKHYTDCERKCRVYNEVYTGDWWWAVQVRNRNTNVILMLIALINFCARLLSNSANQA